MYTCRNFLVRSTALRALISFLLIYHVPLLVLPPLVVAPTLALFTLSSRGLSDLRHGKYTELKNSAFIRIRTRAGGCLQGEHATTRAK